MRVEDKESRLAGLGGKFGIYAGPELYLFVEEEALRKSVVGCRCRFSVRVRPG